MFFLLILCMQMSIVFSSERLGRLLSITLRLLTITTVPKIVEFLRMFSNFFVIYCTRENTIINFFTNVLKSFGYTIVHRIFIAIEIRRRYDK